MALLETDLDRIKRLAERKSEENWQFRSYLKNINMKQQKLDSLVHGIYEEVSSQIDCTKCANCCKVMYPVLKKMDIKRFAGGINLSMDKFKKQFLSQGETKSEFYFNEKPCPFLKDNLCKNYEFRPNDCESYPHLHKDGFVMRLMGVVENYSICPIVFNVYEILKSKLWRNYRGIHARL